jgi:hypothetical protein
VRLGAKIEGGVSPIGVRGGWTVGQYILCLGVSPVLSVYLVRVGCSAAWRARISAWSLPEIPVWDLTLNRVDCTPCRIRCMRLSWMDLRSSEWMDLVAVVGSWIIF